MLHAIRYAENDKLLYHTGWHKLPLGPIFTIQATCVIVRSYLAVLANHVNKNNAPYHPKIDGVSLGFDFGMSIHTQSITHTQTAPTLEPIVIGVIFQIGITARPTPNV